MAPLLSATGHRRALSKSQTPRQHIVLLAGRRIPECDVIEASVTAAANAVAQDLVTFGELGPDWDGWVESGRHVQFWLANRTDFAAVRRAAFAAGAVTAEVGSASAVAFTPGEGHLVPPRLLPLAADYNGRRIEPRRRASASTSPLVVWDAALKTPAACAVAVGAIHQWIRSQERPVLTRWFDKGCQATVIGMGGENINHMLTYGVDRATLSRSASGRPGAGVCSPAMQR